ncbi:hypothetical protein [Arenimonas donghaensis]|uniref:Lipoprotein n=1 Tax=Arenimonas donghaensis DSM 18148 = HO3-R19 TaxID=1121014 RepID=A0A087MGS0_9GAMM|nr:hypothetical protein [Arenimonas donghaensis]KFL36073.1 hypothetical protein N788_05875 [Arenimonas donghaensis DSM 18148 = HO3-R19]
MAPSARLILVACLAVLSCGACSRDRHSASETLVDEALEANARQQAEDTAGQARERELTLETEAGLYRASSGDDLPLPAGFPGDITLPADARIVTATELGDTLSLGLHSPRSVELVLAEFRRAQRAAGWTESTMQDQATVRIAGFDKGDRYLEANVVQEPEGGSTLTITVGPAAD